MRKGAKRELPLAAVLVTWRGLPGCCAKRAGCAGARVPQSARLCQAPHLVALDQRQRDRGWHHERSRVDEARWHRRVSTGGCIGGERAGCRQEDLLRHAGVVPRGASRGGRGEAARAGDVDLQLTGLERGWGAVGKARAGDEKARVERDQCRWAAKVRCEVA